MRLLYFADIRFPLERANGIQTMQTCHALAARGHAVALVVRPDSSGEDRDPFAFYGLPPIDTLTIRRVPRGGSAARRRLRYLAYALGSAAVGRRADIVFTRDLGVASALLVIALDVLVFQPALKVHLGSVASQILGSKGSPAPWKGFLASFYGGFNEEILLRLGVMSLLAWLGRFIFLSSKASRNTPVREADGRTAAEGRPMLAVLWVANVLAAVLFGLGHLPATSLLVPLTLLVVLRAIVLNGLIGVTCGYLYFKHGLESAILSHFSADIVLHVLFAI